LPLFAHLAHRTFPISPPFTQWRGGIVTPKNKDYVGGLLNHVFDSENLRKAYDTGAAALLAQHSLSDLSLIPPPSYAISDNVRFDSLMVTPALSNTSLISVHRRLCEVSSQVFVDKTESHKAMSEVVASVNRDKGKEIKREIVERLKGVKGEIVERFLEGQDREGEDVSVDGLYKVDEEVVKAWRKNNKVIVGKEGGYKVVYEVKKGSEWVEGVLVQLSKGESGKRVRVVKVGEVSSSANTHSYVRAAADFVHAC